jgi:hypothetical protein
MRESQMKKIIALAVAGAFVAPVMAADVTIGGDVEYIYSSQDGVLSTSVGDADFYITGSEELSNGMTVKATLDYEDADIQSADSVDSKLALSGDFGTFEFGKGASEASAAFEDAADVAEAGAGAELADGFSSTGSVDYRGVFMGATVAASYAIGASDTTSVAYGISAPVGPVTLAYSTADSDGVAKSPSSISAKASFGAVYVGVEKISNNGGTENNDVTAVGVTYNYGPGKLFYEVNDYTGAATGKDETSMGVSYKIGGVVNTYIAIIDEDTEKQMTSVGIEYSF